MALIKYIGGKPRKTDNVANTGTVWHGPGDVQDVADDKAVAALLAHSGVWALAEEAPAPAAARWVLTNESGASMALDDMTDKAVRDFAADCGVSLPPKIKGDALREAVYQAIAAAGQEPTDNDAQG